MLRARRCEMCGGPNYRITSDLCKRCPPARPDDEILAELPTPPSIIRKPYTPRLDGTIYAVSANNAIKIGFTTSGTRGRIAALQTGNPHVISVLAECPGLQSDERNLHALLASSRLTGEWFKPTPETIRVVLALKLGNLGLALAVRCLPLSSTPIPPLPPSTLAEPTPRYAFNRPA